MALSFFKNDSDKNEYTLHTHLDAEEIKKLLQEQLDARSPCEFATPFSSDYTFRSIKSGFELTKYVPSNGRNSGNIIVTGIISPFSNGSTVTLQYQRNGDGSGITALLLLIVFIAIGIIDHFGFLYYVGCAIIMFVFVLMGITRKGLRGEMFIMHADITKILAATAS